MKKTFKLTYVFVLALVLTTFSCSNDDHETVDIPISVENLSITIDENPTNGQSVGTVQTDGDGTLNYSITSQTPAGALNINTNTGEVTVADATLFDFETNPILTATVSMVGAANTSTVTINLTDINETSIQDLMVAIDENPANGDAVGTVQVDGNGPFTFSIDAQTPAGALDINTSTGELTVADATLFDFETNPAITATVSVVGASSTSAVTIDLNDLDEISAQDLTATIDENPTDGQVVGSIQVDGGGTFSFSITSQTPAGALAVNTSTGELTVVDPNQFDFETNPILTATVLVDNAVITTEAFATINLTDLDEVSAQNSTITINENPTNGDVLGSLQATGGNLNFTITFQNPAGALEIDASTGELTVADAALFDFETYPNMLATVSVENAVNIVSVNATVNLINQNEVGDFFGGGIVFWVDPANNTHGLICASSDNSTGVAWGSNTISVPIANDTSIGAGAANTAAIVAANTAINTAADVVANASINGFNDWFLPSRDELYQIFLNQTIINTTALANGGASLGGTLWSSSQFSNSVGTAYFLGVSNGSLNGTGKLAQLNFRAVRAF